VCPKEGERISLFVGLNIRGKPPGTPDQATNGHPGLVRRASTIRALPLRPEYVRDLHLPCPLGFASRSGTDGLVRRVRGHSNQHQRQARKHFNRAVISTTRRDLRAAEVSDSREFVLEVNHDRCDIVHGVLLRTPERTPDQTIRSNLATIGSRFNPRAAWSALGAHRWCRFGSRTSAVHRLKASSHRWSHACMQTDSYTVTTPSQKI
jgi:hypothetical protein